jgi:Transglutaminase-like superfamily
MPLTPLVHVTLPDLDENSVEAHFAPVVLLLEGPIKVNEFHIARSLRLAAAGQGIPIPPLYASGVYYEEDPAGREDWRDVFSVLARGKGDCDNLVCWRVAELRVAGIAAEPVIKWQHIPAEMSEQLGYPCGPDGLWMVHCCVRFPDGSIEDTSKNLGMGANFTSKV